MSYKARNTDLGWRTLILIPALPSGHRVTTPGLSPLWASFATLEMKG